MQQVIGGCSKLLLWQTLPVPIAAMAADLHWLELPHTPGAEAGCSRADATCLLYTGSCSE
jgi:hypothetical protein